MKTTKNYSLMRKMSALTMLLVLVLANVNFTFAQTEKPDNAPKTEQTQPKFALLVGVTNYKNQTINKIDGCENNVPLLAETLIKDYGFDQKNVVSLLNEKATKDAIISNFQTHLIENAKKAKTETKEALIVYYFCGHGSQHADQDADENDSLDETFVAYDSRTGNIFDILDDEIDDLKTELRDYTKNTTLILESCHSGTGSKGNFQDNQFITQETDDDTRINKTPYKRKYKPTEDADAFTFTEIAASLSTNTAKSESAQYCNCEKPQSLMTKALIQGLKRATPATTYRGLIREVSEEVAAQSRQEPQVEGNRDALLFGGAARRAKPYIEIENILPNNQITMRAGAIHGLKEGSQISVYSSASLENTGKKDWLANGIVVKVGNAAAVVQMPTAQENPLVKDIKITSHAVLASPIFGGGSVLLSLNASGAKPASIEEAKLNEEIQKYLNEDNLVENQIIKPVAFNKITVSEKREAKGIIRLRRGKVGEIFSPAGLKKPFSINPLKPATECDGYELKTNAPESRFPAPDALVYYLDDGETGGAPLFGKTFDPADQKSAERIAAAIKSFAYQKNLLGLDNAASTLASQIKVSVQAIPENEMVEGCDEKGKTIKPNAGKYKGFQAVKNNTVPVNAFVQINIKNISGEIRKKIDQYASGEAFHIAVLALTNSGEIKNLYGSKGANSAVQDAKEIKIRLKASEPLGIEKYIIVVSKDNFDFSFYETRGASKSVGFNLGKILTQSGAKSKNAGTIIKNEPDNWDVIHLELNIADCKDMPKNSKLCAN